MSRGGRMPGFCLDCLGRRRLHAPVSQALALGFRESQRTTWFRHVLPANGREVLNVNGARIEPGQAAILADHDAKSPWRRSREQDRAKHSIGWCVLRTAVKIGATTIGTLCNSHGQSFITGENQRPPSGTVVIFLTGGFPLARSLRCSSIFRRGTPVVIQSGAGAPIR